MKQNVTKQTVFLNSIDFNDKQFQVRTALDPKTVQAYEQLIRDAGLPGLEAFKDRPLLWGNARNRFSILDGWHRLSAARRIGRQSIEADVITGTPSEAMLAAMRANLTHGLQLTLEERKRACLRTIEALKEADGTQPSNEVVARELGMPESTLRSYRTELEAKGLIQAPAKVKGLDGKVQAARKPAAVKLKSDRKEESPPAAPEKPRCSREAKVEVKTDASSTVEASAPTEVASQNPMDLLNQAIAVLAQLDGPTWKKVKNRDDLRGVIQALIATAQVALKAEAKKAA